MKSKLVLLTALILVASMTFLTACNVENKVEETEAETTAYSASAENVETTTKTASSVEETVTEVITEIVTNDEGETEVVTEIVTKEKETITKKTADKQEEATEKKTFTTEEIVEMFNVSANKIKTDAVKVVKNYETRDVNRDKTQIPAAVEEAAENMLGSLMKDDEAPSVYAAREEIVEKYLVPEQNYVSKLQAKYVEKATCKDTGSTYEIYIKLKNQTNPTAGVGVGAVCDVIEAHEVAEGAPFVDKFTTDYYNCEVKATIDKATGRVIHTNYRTPLVLNIAVSLFGKHNISVGFTFEKDYDITY